MCQIDFLSRYCEFPSSSLPPSTPCTRPPLSSVELCLTACLLFCCLSTTTTAFPFQFSIPLVRFARSAIFNPRPTPASVREVATVSRHPVWIHARVLFPFGSCLCSRLPPPSPPPQPQPPSLDEEDTFGGSNGGRCGGTGGGGSRGNSTDKGRERVGN